MHAHPLEARIAHVEGAFDQVNERLGSIERRLDSSEHLTALRFDLLDRRLESFQYLAASRFDQIGQRFDSFEHLTASRFDQVERRFNWLTGIVVGTWATAILTILFHH